MVNGKVTETIDIFLYWKYLEFIGLYTSNPDINYWSKISCAILLKYDLI